MLFVFLISNLKKKSKFLTNIIFQFHMMMLLNIFIAIINLLPFGHLNINFDAPYSKIKFQDDGKPISVSRLTLEAQVMRSINVVMMN